MNKIKTILCDKRIIFILAMAVLAYIDVHEYNKSTREAILAGGYVKFANQAVMIIGSIMIIVIMILIMRNKGSIEHLFFVAALSLGIAYIVAMPIFTVPDEKAHFDTTYELSNKILGIDDTDDPSTMFKRKCDDQYYCTYFREDLYTKYEEEANSSTDDSLIEVPSFSTGDYFAYIIPAIGVTVSRIVGLKFSYLAMSGMILNLLFYVFGMAYAIRRTPIGKNALAAVGLLPLTLQQARSYSYDVPIFVASSIIVALALAWQDEKKIKSKGEVILYVICAFLLFYLKSGVYAIIAFLPWILMLKKSYFTKKRVVCIIGCIAGVLGILLVIICATEVGDIIYEIITAKPYVVHCDGYARPILYYIEHPDTLISLFINTIDDAGKLHAMQIRGNQLGVLEIPASAKVMDMIRIVFLFSCLGAKNEKYVMKFSTRVILLVMSVSMAFLSALAMLLYWTPAGSMVIMGIQGRYFIPSLYPAALAIGVWKKPRMSEDVQKYLVVAMAALSYITVLVLLRYTSSFSM